MVKRLKPDTLSMNLSTLLAKIIRLPPLFNPLLKYRFFCQSPMWSNLPRVLKTIAANNIWMCVFLKT